MGRRSRQRNQQTKLAAPVAEYRDAEGNVLALRGSLTPAARREYADTMASGLHRDDARQRATELLFERLAVAWTISGLEITRQKELLGRYRMATTEERQFVREALREHTAEHFPELQAPRPPSTPTLTRSRTCCASGAWTCASATTCWS